MVRTVISLSEDDKAWLGDRAKAEGVTMTQLVRRAVRLLRERTQSSDLPTEDLLQATSGIWQQGDGLVYQGQLRYEW